MAKFSSIIFTQQKSFWPGLRDYSRLAMAAAALFGGLSSAQARTFRNAYITFDMADRWNCTLEQTEWVCRTQASAYDPREAIIILTAKEVGPTDSLAAYEQHLKTPRSLASRTGQPIQSQVVKVEQRLINQHLWVDGMHLASEVPNYYSRYLATTKDKIAILVTFSAHKVHYSKYSSDFFKSIESLRVTASKNIMGQSIAGGGAPGADFLGGANSGSMGAGDELPEEGQGGGKGGISTTLLIAVALGIGLLGLILMLRKGQKKRPKNSQRK